VAAERLARLEAESAAVALVRLLVIAPFTLADGLGDPDAEL
jgi:hypothetical protein